MQTCNNNHVIKSKGCNYCNSLSTNQPPKNCISHKCKYFLISEQQITGGSTAIIFIDNPKNNCKTISINKLSITNYNCKYIETYIVNNLNSTMYNTSSLNIKSPNLGCLANTAVKASYAIFNNHTAKCYLNTLSQRLQQPLCTNDMVSKDNKFIVPPGKSFAILITSAEEDINIGIDIRWEAICK